MQHENPIQSSYNLLKSVLRDAFQLQVLLLTHPYENIAQIDLGLRAMIWSDYNDDSTRTSFSNTFGKCQLIVVKSNLGFYNLLALVSSASNPDMISVGPFRDEDLSADYYTQIIKEAKLTPQELSSLKHVYEKMPFVQLDSAIKVTQHIIGTFIPEFAQQEPRFVEYSEQNRSIAINTDLLQTYTTEYAEVYKDALLDFLTQLKTGNYTNGRRALESLLTHTKEFKSKTLRESKMLLHSLNNYCLMALYDTNVHPVHVVRLFASLQTKIESTTTSARLDHMFNEICRRYCMLVKNYANSDYSKLVRDVISYIQLHLEDELTLNTLSVHFGRNASALSAAFSRETDTSLTKYIHQTRIQKAIQLFNTTDQSVSEVAISVGYHDFSYFSKQFSKIVGCSPREYRGRI